MLGESSSRLNRTIILVYFSNMIKQEPQSIVCKSLHAEAPLFILEKFNRVSQITSRTLRSSILS